MVKYVYHRDIGYGIFGIYPPKGYPPVGYPPVGYPLSPEDEVSLQTLHQGIHIAPQTS